MAGTYALTAADHGGAVAWVAPTYKNSRPLWRFAERMVAPVAGSVVVNKTDRTIDFPSGGWLGIYSADAPDSLRGDSFDVVIVDEASRVREDTWTDVIQPTLADRGGRAMLISTPKGRNWFWREFMRGRAAMDNECAAFTAPSSANPNPNIRAAAERARHVVSDRTYRQEWLAEFVEDGGGVFRGVRQAATASWQQNAAGDHQYVIGVDWARDVDYTVFSAIDLTSRQQCYLERTTGVDYVVQRDRLMTLARRLRPVEIIAEANAMGAPNIELLLRAGLPVRAFTTTNATKANAIEALTLAFERGDLAILNDPAQLAELEAYEQERLPSGLVRYSAPEGMHDDTVIALALAWQGAVAGASWGNL